MKETTFVSKGQMFRVHWGSHPFRVEVRKESGFTASAWFSPQAMLQQLRGPGCIARREAYKKAVTKAVRTKSGYNIFHSVVR
jgi:hypothetical protein